KDEKFEEILDLFKETSAKEVIFVLPKKSRSFTTEEDFIILANEASKTGKKISILCSNPELNKIAKKYKFDVLMTKNPEKEPLITTVNQYHPKEEFDDEKEKPKEEKVLAWESADENKDDEAKEEELEYGTPTAVTIRTRGGLEGILRKEDGMRLDVSPKKEKPVSLEIHKKSPHRSVEEIENVWESLPNRDDKNIWADFSRHPNRPSREFGTRRLILTYFQFRNFSKKTVMVLGIISVVLLGSVIYVSTGSAKIDIRPQKQAMEMEIKVLASDKFSLVDQNLNKIPGQLFSIDKTVSKTFPATGERDVAQKARGKIRVFNAYGTTPQVLVATTRFEKDGLIFRTLTTVTVPGTRVSNGEITPGSVEVEVVADKAGDTYNITPGRFTIPAFKERADTGRYEKIYGESTEIMKGGKSGRAKVVTESDYNSAKETLQNQLQKEINEGLNLQTAGLKTLDGLTVKIGPPESSAKIDEATDTFTMSIKGSLKTIGFKETDLKGLLKESVNKTKNLDVLPDRLKLTYKSIAFRDAENTLEFTVAVSGDAYAKIDSAKIKQELTGKDEEDIKSYLRGVPGIETAKVILSPFWVKRIPDKAEKTNINILY
ncbi:MAG: hypothetical protein WD989_02170, partial [Candidatus Paceibacterota bacterium]